MAIDTTDKTVRMYLSNICEIAARPLLGNKGSWYDDSEALESMEKFSSNIGLLHREETTLTEISGLGVAEYKTPYCAIWICPKDFQGKTGTKTSNQDRLNNWIESIGNIIEASNADNSRPWSKSAVISAYGLFNEEDGLGLPGKRDFKRTLMIYVWIDIYHERFFNCT